MSVEIHAGDGAARPLTPFEAMLGAEPRDDTRPNVSGDLSTVLQARPMFRRSVVGYDRFQVDTYVQWAEDELIAADHEREHLVARLLHTRADLDEARQLLSHSAGGGEFLQLSRRIGSMLAVAADEAESIRSDAQAHRSAAAAEANRKLGYARWRIAYAEARAKDVAADAAARFQERAAEADRIVAAAERTRADAAADAEARLLEVRAIEQRAAEHAECVRRAAVEEATAARVQAQGEIVAMLATAREARQRADAEAATARERLARDAAAHVAALLAEVQTLEHRRASLRADLDLLTGPVPEPVRRGLGVQIRTFLDRHRWRSRSLRTH